MLSLSSPAYQTSLCRAQPISDVFYPYVFPTDNGFQFNPLLHGSKVLPILNPTQIATKVTDTIIEKSNSHQSLTLDLQQQSRDQSCHLTNDQKEIQCQKTINQMNGPDDLRMTGSSNQRAEQLGWLAEVATGAVSSRVPNMTPASSDHDKNNSPTTPIHHNSESNSRSSLGPMLHGSSPSNPRMYAPTFQPEHLNLPPPTQQHHHHQTSAVSGLYYSQAPRNAPYTNFYHTDYRSTMPYHPCVNDTANQSRLSRPYFQNNTYSPTLTSIANVQMQTAHAQVPHSPGYLHSAAAITSSPTVFSSCSSSSQHGRMSLTFSSVPANRSVQEQISQEHQNNHLTLQVLGHRGSPQFHQEERRSYKSPEPNLASKSESPARDAVSLVYSSDSSSSRESRHNPSPSHLGYKVPTGKEGSLKHRILRPPSINILEPPQSLLDAPHSAPPIRTHREPSPKQLKPESYRSISTSSSFLLDSSQTHTLLQQEAPRLSPAFLVPSDSTPSSVTVPHNPPNSSECGPQNLKYPPAFMKGSIIQLANSQLKPVEQMTTEDFMECEALSSNLKIDSSTVNSIEKMPSTGSAKLGFSVGPNKVQITVEAPLEHPFFVYMQGWSSCSPERSLLRYGLTCNKLKVGDTCIFLTVKSDVKQSTTSSSSVPTNHASQPSNTSVSVSFDTSKGGIVQRVTSNSYNCSLSYTNNSRDKATKSDTPQRETKQSVPLFLQNIISSPSSSKNDAVADGPVTPGNRKRRWSAPGKVILDPPCSST